MVKKIFLKFYLNNNFNKNNLAFSLLEVILVISIFFILGIGLYQNIFNISLDYQNLKNDSELITNLLIKARQKSILGEENSSWGIYFENTTTDSFYLFQGINFSTSAYFQKFNLSFNNKFLFPQEGSTTQVFFTKFNGKPNTTTKIVLYNSKINLTATITINYTGNIDYSIK
ncbi:MAG: hypothetical protein NZ866_01825 [Patescibacteria group bacterium]|nr:hypothetical protein [Patescibacteria group bacterium]